MGFNSGSLQVTLVCVDGCGCGQENQRIVHLDGNYHGKTHCRQCHRPLPPVTGLFNNGLLEVMVGNLWIFSGHPDHLGNYKYEV